MPPRNLPNLPKIFVPRISSPAKIQRIRDFGADLVVGGERYPDAFAASEAWRAESGALGVHAFDQVETMLGQGTIGLELDEQAPDIDTLLIGVGGGGLIGGIAAWYANRIRVIGVEPEAAPTLYKALEAGGPVDAEMGGIAADSLAPRRVGELVFPLARKHVERVILVTRRCHSPGAEGAVGYIAGRRRARCGRCLLRPDFRTLSSRTRREGWRAGQRRQYRGGGFRPLI